eukprot:NODE_2637_length_1072_cov_7.625611_g2198_i0.p7 GENE.NODE_2637_length_1072_cov_7.625611_g2198_i0~~NODE_2637_length_1072_cov_7.625611_g2198_i0.p7  ORF type:complete len:71 (-),score=5.30 NODE_2637_length_1072_cov_7.625611_g2198_i0:578-790(-)
MARFWSRVGLRPVLAKSAFLAFLAKIGGLAGLLAAKADPAGDLRSCWAFGPAWPTGDHFWAKNGPARCHF